VAYSSHPWRLLRLYALAGNFDGNFRCNLNYRAIIGRLQGKGGFKTATVAAPGVFAFAVLADRDGNALCLAVESQLAG
jgi:hypothetical protein